MKCNPPGPCARDSSEIVSQTCPGSVPAAAAASVRGPAPQGGLLSSSARNPSQQRARAGELSFLGTFFKLSTARSQEQGTQPCHQQLRRALVGGCWILPECALASSSCPSCPELSPPFLPVLQSPGERLFFYN